MLRSLTVRRIVSQALYNSRSPISNQAPTPLRFSTSSPKMSVTQITSYEQFQDILKSDKVIALDAFAEWCGPCKMISPLYKKFAAEAPADKIEFYEFDVDAQEKIAQELGISAMPTFTFFKGGQKVHQVIGANPQKLQAAIKDHSS